MITQIYKKNASSATKKWIVMGDILKGYKFSKIIKRSRKLN